MIPACTPADLPAEAQDLYRRALDARGLHDNSLSIKPENTEKMAAAQAIADARLGTLARWPDATPNDPSFLSVIAPHPRLSIADSEHDTPVGLYATIEVFTTPEDVLSGVARPDQAPTRLLAVARGAVYRAYDRDRALYPRWTLQVRHSSLRDEEHDSCDVGRFTVHNPTLVDIDSRGTVLAATLIEAAAYPAGTNPAHLDQGPCTDCYLGESGHYFADYSPPEDHLRSALGSLVRLTLRPAATVDRHGLPLY